VKDKVKIAIIMPSYNEERRIGATLEDYSCKLAGLQLKGIEYTIIVVINNTNDNSPEIIEKWSKINSRIQYLRFRQGGKGFAITEGWKYALKSQNFDLIGFVDADNATSPEEYIKLAEKLIKCQNIKRKVDGVIASRYIPGAIVNPKQSVNRIIVSRMFNFLVRCLFPVTLGKIKDSQCGAKIFKARVIQDIINNLSISKWAFDVNLLYLVRRKKYKIIEHPIIWSDKLYSKLNFWKAGPQMALAIIRLRILNSPFKPIIKLYDKIINKRDKRC